MVTLGDLISKLLTAAMKFVSILSHLATQIETVLIILVIFGVLYSYRDRFERQAYEATIAKLHCPDFRDMVCCGCCSLGYWIMNVCCPFCCYKFHAPFQLRLIIVQAARLPMDFADRIDGHRHIYAEVRAGDNPKKSTSVQKYCVDGRRLGLADPGRCRVIWNEPIDLAISPSTSSVYIELRSKSVLGDAEVGSVTVPIDAFYEDPGTCSDCPCCGYYCCPKFCRRVCGREYKWPLVQGAPNIGEERQKRNKRKIAPSKRPEACMNEYEAKRAVKYDGMQLEHVPAEFRENSYVVKAAVRHSPKAIKFASERLRADPEVQRLHAGVPKPMILELEQHGDSVGRIWVYFVLSGDDDDDPATDTKFVEAPEGPDDEV